MSSVSKNLLKLEFDEKQVKPSEPLTESQRLKCRWTRLDCLLPGDRFEIQGLQDNFRNLYVLRVSDCSVSVKGDSKFDADEDYKPLGKGYNMSCSTTVKRL